MNVGRTGPVSDPLRTLFAAGTAAGLTDAQLLERFASRRDEAAEAAFAALVSRHGPMVRRACRSLVADPNDADDVFQATFLVLARKAGTIRRPELLANWLYGTAHRAARTLKKRAARRRKHEAREAAMATRGLRPIRTGSNGRRCAARRTRSCMRRSPDCPQACRAAVVLCDLEGRPQAEVAHLLRCSDRTLRAPAGSSTGAAADSTGASGANTDGRRARRGPRPRAGLGGYPTNHRGRNSPRGDPLRGRTVAVDALSASTMALAQEVLRSMLIHKLKLAALTLLLLGAFATSAGFACSLAGESRMKPRYRTRTLKRIQPRDPRHDVNKRPHVLRPCWLRAVHWIPAANRQDWKIPPSSRRLRGPCASWSSIPRANACPAQSS